MFFFTFNLAKKVLKTGANPNQPAKELKTPLYYAVQYNKDTIAELLLQFGANPDMHIQGFVSHLIFIILLNFSLFFLV